MDQSALMRLGIALGLTYAVYRFAPFAAAKAGAVAVGAVIVAKQIPYVKTAL